jgi:Beta-galactosidase
MSWRERLAVDRKYVGNPGLYVSPVPDDWLPSEPVAPTDPCQAAQLPVARGVGERVFSPAQTMPRLLAWPCRFALALALVALVTGSFATSADAAKRKRKVPFGFFGTFVPPEMSPDNFSDATLDRQMAVMARSGVESVRLQLHWSGIEPTPGVYKWRHFDGLVASAARHRLTTLVNVISTPSWASPEPLSPVSERFPPSDANSYAAFMRQLVQRYGPRGSLWRENPRLPYVPVREWQIWNEPMAPWQWNSRPWYRSFTRLLKAAYPAIHAADRRAKVVAGSLVSVGRYAQWDGMRDLYRAGARRYFDVVAIHPFTNDQRSVRNTVARTIGIIRFVRRQMRKYHDRRKQIYLTELTWSAALGKVPRARLLGLETTPRGQAARMRAAYRQLVRDWRKYRVTQTYWFSWASPYDANSPQSDVSFRFAGLNRLRPNGTFSPMPILRTYGSLAARYEGCRKTSSARRCRRR